MFGYVTINPKSLTDEEKKRYRSYYCGLCLSLKNRFGTAGRLTLSYDMTFLSIVLAALYELPETALTQRCPVHPTKPQVHVLTEATDYCADMNIVLSYYKAVDDWMDEKRLSAKTAIHRLESPLAAVRERYPQKCSFVESCLQEMHKTESCGRDVLDTMCNLTGKMLGEIYAWKDDLWQDDLRLMGEGLGRFIYLMDAYDDLQQDERKNRFNPLTHMRQESFEDYIQTGLTLMIAEGTEAFERLPILQDASLVRNVLYSGVWSKFARMKKKEAKEHENDG